MNISRFSVLLTAIVGLTIANLLIGSVSIPATDICRILFFPVSTDEGQGEVAEIWSGSRDCPRL